MLHSVTKFRHLTLSYLTGDNCVLTDGWGTAPRSFLFSLRNNDDYPSFKSSLKNSEKYTAIYRHSLHGPTFGSGKDLSILPNNGHSYTDFGPSYQLPSHYVFASPRSRALLAGSYHFTPAEVEVLTLI